MIHVTSSEELPAVVFTHPSSTNRIETDRVSGILETHFQQRALENMRAGGKYKGSANLPEVQHIDVREAIARIAGGGSRNVSNVRNILKNAHPHLRDALRDGVLSINGAMHLLELPKPNS